MKQKLTAFVRIFMKTYRNLLNQLFLKFKKLQKITNLFLSTDLKLTKNY